MFQKEKSTIKLIFSGNLQDIFSQQWRLWAFCILRNYPQSADNWAGALL